MQNICAPRTSTPSNQSRRLDCREMSPRTFYINEIFYVYIPVFAYFVQNTASSRFLLLPSTCVRYTLPPCLRKRFVHTTYYIHSLAVSFLFFLFFFVFPPPPLWPPDDIGVSVSLSLSLSLSLSPPIHFSFFLLVIYYGATSFLLCSAAAS